MTADPEPQDAVVNFKAERPVGQPDADGSETANLLEVQRGVLRVSAGQNFYRRTLGPIWGGRDNKPKIRARRNASQIRALARCRSFQGCVGQGVQFARTDIVFNLAIPGRRIEFSKPFTKRSQLIGG